VAIVNDIENTKAETEIKELLSKCRDLRISLEQSISEILEYTKIFEKANGENFGSENSKKESEVGEA
jgi:hypothetical protein